MKQTGKRYFWAVVVGNADKGFATLEMHFETENAKYPKKSAIMKAAEDVFGVKDGVITNIIELSESDYKDFSAA